MQDHAVVSKRNNLIQQIKRLKQEQDQLSSRILAASDKIKSLVKDKKVILFIGDSQVGKKTLAKALINAVRKTEGPKQEDHQNNIQGLPFKLQELNNDTSICTFQGFQQNGNLFDEIILSFSVMQVLKISKQYKIIIVVAEDILFQSKFRKFNSIAKEISANFKTELKERTGMLRLWVNNVVKYKSAEEVRQVLRLIEEGTGNQSIKQVCNYLVNNNHIEILKKVGTDFQNLQLDQHKVKDLLNFSQADNSFVNKKNFIFLGRQHKNQIDQKNEKILKLKQQIQIEFNKLRSMQRKTMQIKLSIYKNQLESQKVKQKMAKMKYQENNIDQLANSITELAKLGKTWYKNFFPTFLIQKYQLETNKKLIQEITFGFENYIIKKVQQDQKSKKDINYEAIGQTYASLLI